MTRPVLEELSWDECFKLLKERAVGRLIYRDVLGLAAVPVNFAVAGNAIVFRSEAGSKVRGLQERDIAFQVDQIDTASHSGWSVLIRGGAEVLEYEVAESRLSELIGQIDGSPPRPWKNGSHNIWVVITAKAVSGRRLAASESDDFWLF
jgi:nitroimidazol reductase NimA-like FMN-containing flavoprotein (pyridoxamine 5'-phosphate oxidase superfamily)